VDGEVVGEVLGAVEATGGGLGGLGEVAVGALDGRGVGAAVLKVGERVAPEGDWVAPVGDWVAPVGDRVVPVGARVVTVS
jgi:hypothetical protein